MQLRAADLETPIGSVRLVEHEGKLCALSLPGRWTETAGHLKKRFGPFELARADSVASLSAVRAFFEGRLTALDDVEVDPGGSAFQEQVWAALRAIRVGRTTSYSALATTIGQPGAARAVATANATNPVAIVIPCHRVIHADGTLSGYGGGVDRKRWLLRHEGALLF